MSMLFVLVVESLRKVPAMVNPCRGDRLIVIRLVVPPLADQMLDSLLEAAKYVLCEGEHSW